MRIIRPQQLVVLKNGYQLGRESYLGISVIAGCYLSRTTQFANEAEIWQAWKSAPLSFPVLDAAEPKPFAEYLLAGHAGIKRAVSTLDVGVRIGELSRQWRVEGESNSAATAVEPFLTIPMDHPQAWGGKENKENPLGRGYRDERNPRLMTIDDSNGAVACSPLAAPSPIPYDFQLRKAHIDKIAPTIATKHYLETVFPGLPEDIDRRYFQMAGPSQWLSSSEWPDRVPFELEGFSPKELPISGEFPAVRARAFCRFKDDDDPMLMETPLERKTLWLLPDSNLGLMVFTGCIPLTHLFDEPLETLMVALDRVDKLREPNHFQQVYGRRTAKGASSFEFLFDPDLMPEAMELNVIDGLQSHPDSLRYQSGPAPAEKAGHFYQRVREAIEQKQQQDDAKLQLSPVEWEKLPPEQQNQWQEWLKRGEAEANNLEFVKARLGQQEFINKTFTYCRFRLCDMTHCIFTDCSFEHCVFDEGSLHRSRFTRVTLSNCTLNYTDLDEVEWIECKLQQLTLESIVAKHSVFTSCEWEKVIVNEGNFNNSWMESCKLSQCMFSDTHMLSICYENGRILSCVFNQCLAEQSQFINMVLEKNSLLSATWTQCCFEKCQITSMTCGMSSDLSDTQFIHCWLNKVGLSRTYLARVSMIHCAVSESNCDGADLSEAQVTSCDMTGMRFKDANLVHTRWKNTGLQQSLFYNADLRDSHFSYCNLVAANMAMIYQNVNTCFERCLVEKTSWLPRRSGTADTFRHPLMR